jgi:hypothetical protein
LAFAPDILAGIMTITFDAEPDVADHLEKLCRITSLGAGELINILLDPPLRQIIKDKDSGFLQCCIQAFVYEAKEEALEAIARYERFISEDESGCYHSDAKPARTRDGHWEILFKSTHPWDEGEARYQ